MTPCMVEFVIAIFVRYTHLYDTLYCIELFIYSFCILAFICLCLVSKFSIVFLLSNLV